MKLIARAKELSREVLATECEDGRCSICGCEWQEEGITDPHLCPPGFGTDEQRAGRALLQFGAEVAQECFKSSMKEICRLREELRRAAKEPAQ